MDKPRVLIIWNDSLYHKGSVKSKFWEEKLTADGFDVERVNSTYPLCDPDRLRHNRTRGAVANSQELTLGCALAVAPCRLSSF